MPVVCPLHFLGISSQVAIPTLEGRLPQPGRRGRERGGRQKMMLLNFLALLQGWIVY